MVKFINVKSKKNHMYDVICIGSSTIDVFAKTEKSDMISFQTQNSKEKESFLAYPVGDKILINDLQTTTGGGGTNTAVSLARLGLNTAYCGNVGKDENGAMIIDSLKNEKIDFIGSRSNERSGYSIILDSIGHDRTILTYKGSNDSFKFSKIDKKTFKTKWLYLCSMTGKSFKELEKVVKYAKKNKIKIIFNPSSYLADKGIEYLRNILTSTDILVLNRDEAKTLVGNHEIDVLLKLLRQLLKSSVVIITDGKKGVYVNDGSYQYFAKANDIKVIETTGAGDAFGSTFLAGMILKDKVDFAVKLAVTNSESVISHHGAKNKLLTLKEAQTIMKKRPIKLTKKKLKK